MSLSVHFGLKTYCFLWSPSHGAPACRILCVQSRRWGKALPHRRYTECTFSTAAVACNSCLTARGRRPRTLFFIKTGTMCQNHDPFFDVRIIQWQDVAASCSRGTFFPQPSPAQKPSRSLYSCMIFFFLYTGLWILTLIAFFSAKTTLFCTNSCLPILR